MKKNLLLAISLIGGLFLFATSCVKEKDVNEKYRPAGSEIRFAAATGYDNGVETRTEYTGDMKTVSGYTNKFERIDWVTDDPLKIYYQRGTGSYSNAIYKITGANTTSNEITKATAEAYGTALYWGDGTGNHKFYGMYPANGFQGNTSANLSNNRASGNIPSAQNITGTQKTLENIAKYMPDMKYAYMVCYQEVDQNSSTSSVELPFSPAVTAFEFRFKLADHGPVTVKSFKLSSASTDLTGNFAFDITGKDNNERTTIGTVTKSSTGREITVSFGSGVQMNTTDILDFTVFALPVDQTDLVIEFTFAATETGAADFTRKLALKHNGTSVTFAARKKYVITNTAVPGEVWDYYIDPIENITWYGHLATTSSEPFEVTSYKVKRGTTTKVPVAWGIEYSANGTSGWTTSNDGKLNVNVLTGGGGSTLTVPNGANVMRDHGTGEYTGDDPDDITVEDSATALLRNAEDIPAGAKDSDGYYDLSKHPVYGSNQFGGSRSMETANCYVVQRPGLYKFPLVYGNAIRNGSANTVAYAPSVASPHGHFLSHFVRHDGQAITGPWITTDNSIAVNDAIIVWQDGTDTAAGQIIKDADVSVDGNYIKFEVKRANIRPGNVVIAARKSDGTIVWSWHIWITEKNLSPRAVKDATNTTFDMMDYNLGWMDATSAAYTAYDTWTTYARVKQTETGGTSRIFRIRQIGDVITVEANVGCNTFYQWGRKDPMLPATGENNDKAQYSAYGLKWESSKNHAATGGIEESIVHPNWQLVNQGGNGTEAHYVGSHYGNLWDAELDNGDGGFSNYGQRFAVKTVYDPCPPGYVVPYLNAFTGFGHQAAGHNIWDYYYTPQYGDYGLIDGTLHGNGWHFNNHMNSTVFFPYCGARAHNGASTDSTNGSIYDVNNCGYYWTSCPLKYDDTGNASGVQYRQTAKMLIMYPTYIRPGHEQRKGAAYAIRPILENVQRVNTGATTGGMEGNTYDFNDGWSIN